MRMTVDTPSTNCAGGAVSATAGSGQNEQRTLVRKMTFALLNMPSFNDTTMNCDCGKCVRIMRPMFCVWLRSSAASTSSKM